MKQSPSIASTKIDVSQTVVAQRITEFLGKRHPSKTALHVSACTGISGATVAKWFERQSAPSASHLLVLLAVYGPAVLVCCYDRPPDWLDLAAQAQEREAIEAEIARLQAML